MYLGVISLKMLTYIDQDVLITNDSYHLPGMNDMG